MTSLKYDLTQGNISTSDNYSVPGVLLQQVGGEMWCLHSSHLKACTSHIALKVSISDATKLPSSTFVPLSHQDKNTLEQWEDAKYRPPLYITEFSPQCSPRSTSTVLVLLPYPLAILRLKQKKTIR